MVREDVTLCVDDRATPAGAVLLHPSALALFIDDVDADERGINGVHGALDGGSGGVIAGRRGAGLGIFREKARRGNVSGVALRTGSTSKRAAFRQNE